MDWPRDNLGLSEKDLENVFKYAPRESTVVHMLRSKDYKIEISSLESEDDWSDWLSKDLPPADGTQSGLVLLLAKRMGEPVIPSVRRATSDDWVKFVSEHLPSGNGGAWLSRVKTFSPLAGKSVVLSEKPAVDVPTKTGSPHPLPGGRRGVRTLPFSAETFKRVAACLHTHGSIARVISRTDVPTFSADKVEMDGQVAYVYNCRSSNAWDLDLALSATYFPLCGMTYAVVYGAYFSACEEIVKRLSRVRGPEAAHPLLVPGIFAELERARHMGLVRSTIAAVETRIFELDVLQQPEDDGGGAAAEEAERRKAAKRNAWLDTTYLRNGLVSWNMQLAKMAQHAADLEGVFAAVPPTRAVTAKLEDAASSAWSIESCHDAGGAVEIGTRIRNRIQAIREEYDDWTRDCTMRVDGMAMATQWAQGETNVEIALATKRDSKHMRSIALLTMVFLPGTFVATLFSMGFFDWKAKEGDSPVSRSIWIYFLVTVVLTLLTVGLWYFFVVIRPSRRRRWEDEDDD